MYMYPPYYDVPYTAPIPYYPYPPKNNGIAYSILIVALLLLLILGSYYFYK
ncbi:hypothetical protein TMU01_17430 [Tenuibacillus multivorans]|uniref:Sporulation protein YjcZ n=1 Tax=Tenuibacillus multivorans TaxID=237069 RepID=A0A1G9ZGT5_9BACI|nr:hypothetical protein TMU01_17430 [Tenuibacillus multivorans]SDN20519.1 hypothetical protein SAMN05216498_1692 [Tenuibacillus multivorans]